MYHTDSSSSSGHSATLNRIDSPRTSGQFDSISYEQSPIASKMTKVASYVHPRLESLHASNLIRAYSTAPSSVDTGYPGFTPNAPPSISSASCFSPPADDVEHSSEGKFEL